MPPAAASLSATYSTLATHLGALAVARRDVAAAYLTTEWVQEDEALVTLLDAGDRAARAVEAALQAVYGACVAAGKNKLAAEALTYERLVRHMGAETLGRMHAAVCSLASEFATSQQPATVAAS